MFLSTHFRVSTELAYRQCYVYTSRILVERYSNMSNEILGDRGKALEELFFARESEKYRKALQDKEEAQNNKEALSASSDSSGVPLVF